MKNFKNKVAVITGAGSGIGRALAQQLAREGALLFLVDINESGLQETAASCKSIGTDVTTKKVNVANLDEIKLLVNDVLDTYNYVDIIFNNAGIALGKKTLTELSYEELERIMGVNLWGVIYGSKEFLPHLLKRSEAAIVNTSSVFGLAGIPEQIPYCTTKFAVRGFTESLRGELGDTSVEVYCVHPGGINTNIAEDALKEAQADPKKRKEVENFKKLLAHSPEMAAKVIIKSIKKKNYKILIGEEAYAIDIMTRALPKVYPSLIRLGMKSL